MEDADLFIISLITGLGTSLGILFVSVYFFPSNIFTVIFAVLSGILIGFLNFSLTKKRETGYFNIPDDIKTLHSKILEIEKLNSDSLKNSE